MIDAHVHYAGDHPESIGVLEELDVRAMNICVAYERGAWSDQKSVYRSLSEIHPSRYRWCTTFDPPDFREKEATYRERVIAGLEEDARNGAIACKVWKNIGMEVRRPDGSYLMVDDPLFSPIFEWLQRSQLPVLMHIAEPLECWKPLDERSPHYDYYSANPKWHMFGRDDIPSHRSLMIARDRLVARHPDIRFIGAHLASLEFDLGLLSSTLDRFSNLAVDVSARIEDLAILHAPSDVRSFVERYQDRVLYGSDFVAEKPQADATDTERRVNAGELRSMYESHRRYFSTGERFSLGGHDIQGAALSPSVFDKLAVRNARSWYGL